MGEGRRAWSRKVKEGRGVRGWTAGIPRTHWHMHVVVIPRCTGVPRAQLGEDEGSAPGSPTANLGALAREVALACHLVHLWPHSKTLTDKQWLFDGTGQVIVFPGTKTK